MDPDADDDYMDEEGYDASSHLDNEEPGGDAMDGVCGNKRKHVLNTRMQCRLYKNGGGGPRTRNLLFILTARKSPLHRNQRRRR